MRHILLQASIAAALLLSACGLEERFPVEMVQMDQSRPLGDEASLEANVSLDIGSIEISGESSSKLYSLDLEYDKANYQPEINYDQAALARRAPLFQARGLASKFRGQRHTNRLRLNLSDAVPVSLRINNGVGECTPGPLAPAIDPSRSGSRRRRRQTLRVRAESRDLR